MMCSTCTEFYVISMNTLSAIWYCPSGKLVVWWCQWHFHLCTMYRFVVTGNNYTKMMDCKFYWCAPLNHMHLHTAQETIGMLLQSRTWTWNGPESHGMSRKPLPWANILYVHGKWIILDSKLILALGVFYPGIQGIMLRNQILILFYWYHSHLGRQVSFTCSWR